MKETVAYCDLDEKDARRPGVAVLKVEIDGITHVVDVCQVHLSLLSRLPTGTTTRGRRRPAKRVGRAPAKRAAKAAPAKAPAKAVAKRVPAKATKAPAKRAAQSAAKATRGGRLPGSRRDQQQRIAAAREWARSQGRAISGKGRLPAGLLEEYEAATR